MKVISTVFGKLRIKSLFSFIIVFGIVCVTVFTKPRKIWLCWSVALSCLWRKPGPWFANLGRLESGLNFFHLSLNVTYSTDAFSSAPLPRPCHCFISDSCVSPP